MSVQQFNEVPATPLPTSTFNLSHDVTLSCNFGQLVPILCQEVLPHDKWRVSSEVFLRFAPMFAPILHRVDCYVHFFFVPYKDIWDDWEDFITGGRVGDSRPVLPMFNRVLDNKTNRSIFGVGTLADYLGFPSLQMDFLSLDENSSVKMSALPFRAYQFIYNEYYRDQNLTEEVPFQKTSGSIDWREFDAIHSLRRRAWEKDYFTSALPWTQRGESVALPVTNLGNVKLDYSTDNRPIFRSEIPLLSGVSSIVSTNSTHSDANPGFMNNIWASLPDGSLNNILFDPNGTLRADVEVGTIDQLRQMTALQRYLEGNARMGARYAEQLRGRWHVRPSDSSMHRPEYLGGGRAPVVISETFQQTGTDRAALGEIGGNAVSLGKTNKFTRFFTEHGLIMGILSIRPKTKYMQGLPRMFMRQSPFDFYTPEFANLGEQPIMTNELFWQPDNTFGLDPSGDEDSEHIEPFGYIPRWSEYRYIPSSVHGDMLTDLDYWHLARKFENRPKLNTSFIEVPEESRIFADTGRYVDNVKVEYHHHVWIEVFHHIKASRPMPKFSVPSII